MRAPPTPSLSRFRRPNQDDRAANSSTSLIHRPFASGARKLDSKEFFASRTICSRDRSRASLARAVVLGHVAAEIRRIVGVDRDAEPALEKRPSGYAARATGKTPSRTLESGHTVSGTRRAASSSTSAGSSAHRTPWSMRRTPSTRALRGCTPAGPPRRRARPAGTRSARARAKTASNFDGGLPASDGVEAHAADPVLERERLVERRLRLGFGEVPEEAEDQLRGDAEPPLPVGERAVDAADDGLERDAPRGVGLRIEEHLGVAHAVGGGAVEIGRRQLEEIPLLAKDARAPRSRCRGRTGDRRNR